MFGLGLPEILIMAAIAILVVPPKDLPGLMRSVGQGIGKVRRMANDFQRQMNDAVRDDELDELRKQMTDMRRDTDAEMRRGLNPSLDTAPRTTGKPTPTPKTQNAPPAVMTGPPATPKPAETATTPVPEPAPAPAETKAAAAASPEPMAAKS